MISVDRRTLNRIALLLLGVAGGVLWVSCSEDTQIGGRCTDIMDCRSEHNFHGGTSCIHGRCVCDNPDLEVCCPGGIKGSCSDKTEYTCRPKAECKPPLPPPPECFTGEDCPPPPDLRCGVATCKAGKCGLQIVVPSPAIAWQKPGDCRTLYCDPSGHVYEQEDRGDEPFDGNPCTLDFCDGDEPQNIPYLDGTPCQENLADVCLFGKCIECINYIASYCDPGEVCTGIDCVPPHCDDNQVNVDETGLDCGGGLCRPCPNGQPCKEPSDCVSKVCTEGKCAAWTHFDDIQNDGETGKDCGCSQCLKKCQDGEGCLTDDDCISGVCYGSICFSPTCFDVTKNGDEEGVDCGGSCELPCSGE